MRIPTLSAVCGKRVPYCGWFHQLGRLKFICAFSERRLQASLVEFARAHAYFSDLFHAGEERHPLLCMALGKTHLIGGNSSVSSHSEDCKPALSSLQEPICLFSLNFFMQANMHSTLLLFILDLRYNINLLGIQYSSRIV